MLWRKLVRGGEGESGGRTGVEGAVIAATLGDVMIVAVFEDGQSIFAGNAKKVASFGDGEGFVRGEVSEDTLDGLIAGGWFEQQSVADFQQYAALNQRGGDLYAYELLGFAAGGRTKRGGTKALEQLGDGVFLLWGEGWYVAGKPDGGTLRQADAGGGVSAVGEVARCDESGERGGGVARREAQASAPFFAEHARAEGILLVVAVQQRDGVILQALPLVGGIKDIADPHDATARDEVGERGGDIFSRKARESAEFVRGTRAVGGGLAAGVSGIRAQGRQKDIFGVAASEDGEASEHG
jgi:hypothetical protein